MDLLNQIDPEGVFLNDQKRGKSLSFRHECIELPKRLSSSPHWKEVVVKCQSPIPNEEKQEVILTFLEDLLNIPSNQPSMSMADRLTRIREISSHRDIENQPIEERGELTQERWAAGEASRERKAAKKRIRRLVKGLPASPGREAFLTNLKEKRGSHLADLQLLFIKLGELMLEYGIIKKSLEENAQQQWKDWVDKKVAELEAKYSDTKSMAHKVVLLPGLLGAVSLLKLMPIGWIPEFLKKHGEDGELLSPPLGEVIEKFEDFFHIYEKINPGELVGKYLGHQNTMQDTKHSAVEEACEYGKQFMQGERQAMEKQHDHTTQTEDRLFQLCLEIANQYKQLCDQANR
ncbi:MAG: hypothetical protein VXZ72_03790 [Chlamydiota bacterium]|nr:hypothetical protein [Chlamydiota bacterium]